jgi:HAD superfamily hydrolase (TIGR01549 family)
MGCSPLQAKEWYEQRYMPLMVKLIGKYQPLGEWVLPFVQDCQHKGIKMVVLSDYGFAKEKLQALGLEPSLFDWVVSAPELGGLKPAAELMHHVAERMGVAIEDCMVIGDREDTDGEMARRCGAQFRKMKY